MAERVSQARLKESYLRPLVVRAREGDQAAASELVEVMRPVVVSLIHLDYYDREQRDEQEAAGYLGLWEAVQRYDPDHDAGKDFKLVAWYRIRHHIQEWLAKNTGVIPMPRTSAWQKGHKIDAELAAYARENPDDPLPEEHMTNEQLDEITGIRHTRAIMTARAESMPFEPELDAPAVDSAESVFFDGYAADLERAALVFLDLLDDLEPEEWYEAARQFCHEWDLDPEIADRLIDAKRGLG